MAPARYGVAPNIRMQLTAAILLLSGCAQPSAEDARYTWLQDTLIEDNYVQIRRAPELTEGKFRKMDATFYNYFRGTAGQYYRDMNQPHAKRFETDFGTTAASSLLLVGDPHPENLGTYRDATGQIVVEFNDFDGARFGSYQFDVLRLALGFWTAGHEVQGWVAADREALAQALAEGYWQQIHSDSPATLSGTAGLIEADLVRRAERDGAIAEELLEYTRVEDGVRVMFYGELAASPVKGVHGDVLVEPDEKTVEVLERLIGQYCNTTVVSVCDRARIKGISGRLGAGVSSYPLPRYYVLIEGPTESVDDDVLLEVKEVRDAPALKAVPVFPSSRYLSNGERVVDAQRILQTTDQADPYLGWAGDASTSYRVRHRTKYQKGFGVDRLVEKVAEDEWTHDDFLVFASLAGRTLARAHADQKTLGGQTGAQAVSDALSQGTQLDFVREVVEFARSYGALQRSDSQMFRDMRTEAGPLLGAKGISQ